MSEKEKVLEKIQKLLNLAGNNPHKEEAESALLKAQVLLLKHKLEMSDVGANDNLKSKIIQAVSKMGANTPWAKRLVNIFSKNFRCMNFYQSYNKTSNPVFFGEEEDAEIAKSMFEYAYTWLEKNSRNYATNLRNTKGIVKGVKQDYILGFLKGIEDKFQAQIDLNNQYALVVVVPIEVKKEYTNLDLTSKRASGRINTHGSAEARSAGYSAGRGFNTPLINE